MATKSDAIIRIVSAFWVRPPRKDMVNSKVPTAVSAVLACEVVPFHNGSSQCEIFGCAKCLIPYWRMASCPMWMAWPYEVSIAGRDATCPLHSESDGGLVRFRNLATCERLRYCRNRLLSGCLCHHVSGSTVSRISGYLRPCGGSFGWVIGQIHIGSLAGVRAELDVATPVWFSALQTDRLDDLCHE